jgi:catechol 2,3-dioxygenase-like lactoylglutathione lyase family enzyme
MIDHVTLRTRDLGRTKRFYADALKGLGYKVLYEGDGAIGMGDSEHPTFWIAQDGPVTANVHLAFTSSDRKMVDAFHAAALGAGGKDNGKPGLRPDYGESYYAAFVHDPDGNNIEAVCLKPQR